jgi:hypothetical protein
VDASGRPVIDLPAGIDTFSGWTSSDAKRAAALRDTADSIRAVDAAIVDGKASTPAMRFYLTDRAYEAAVTWVQGYLKDSATLGGTVRYYRPRFTPMKNGQLEVAYCADETAAFDRSRKTGKRLADNTTGKAKNFVAYNARLVETKKSVWQVADLYGKRGATQCE